MHIKNITSFTVLSNSNNKTKNRKEEERKKKLIYIFITADVSLT